MSKSVGPKDFYMLFASIKNQTHSSPRQLKIFPTLAMSSFPVKTV